ncbi:MAG: phospholipase C, phosphocholine-specific [Dokdonella sp.]
MSTTDRRQFLKMAANSAGAAAVLALLPPAIREALAIPAARATGTLQDVEHVVILMQENRSFDHYFGSLRGVRGFDDPRPIAIPGGDPVWYQPTSGTLGYVLPFRLDTQATGAQCLGDINHSWKGSHTAWKNHDNWIHEKGPMCMGHFTRADIPFYYALADAFTICDAFFCSIQGPTNPNRMHLFTGTSGLGVGNQGAWNVNNVDDGNWTANASLDNLSFPAYTWTTYAERLQDAGISWRVYQEYDNYGDNSLAFFANFRGIAQSSPLYQRGRTIVPGSSASDAYTSTAEYLVAEFERDVQEGSLPQVSWIVAPYLMSEHPEASPAYGESLAARLLAALTANPAIWSKTVFIINYDENGGFFDHIAPPLPALNANLGLNTVDTSTEDYGGVPVGLGIRVPMLVVSPWSKGGWVNSQVFDHTSIIRFLEARFGVAEPNISAWRRTVAGDLTSVFDFANPDTGWPLLPDTGDYIANTDLSCQLSQPGVPAIQALQQQEAGQRPARALPYQLQVHGRIDVAAGKYWLDFVNDGAAGAGLNVYALNRSDGPWFYTLDPATQLSDYWSAATYTQGIYDLAVHGPNGFLRSFHGNLNLAIASGGANPEVHARYDLANDALVLTLQNTGTVACELSARPNHYSGEAPRTYALAAGASIDDIWLLAATSNWYDLSVTSDSDAGFLRRLAGHVETGAPSVSDPAIGERIFANGFDN